jgi:hypothetical protein
MITAGIPELEGKSIEKVEVYSDAVLLALADGKTAVAVFMVGDDLRVEVRSRGPEGARGPAVRVYLGQFPYPNLPDYARRRSTG